MNSHDPGVGSSETTQGTLAARALRLAVLRIGLVALLAGLVSYAVNHRQIEHASREQLLISTQERLQREAVPFFEIQHRDDSAIRDFLEIIQNKARHAELLRNFDLYFFHRADGAWVSYDALYDGVPLADGRIFKHITSVLYPGVELTEDLKIRMAASIPVTANYGNSGFGRHIDFGLIFPEGGLTLYWPGQRYATRLVLTGPNAYRMREQDWFKIGFTEPGPGNARTRMYLDTPSGQWLVSNVSRSPRQVDGSQPISSITDLSLSDLMERAAKPVLPGTDAVIFLANSEGTLIYHPDRQGEIQKSDGKASIVSVGDKEMRHILERVSAGSVLSGRAEIVETSNRLIAFGVVPGTNWVIAIRYPTVLMRQAILLNLGIVVALGLLTLLVEIFLLRSILQDQVAKPLSQLLSATRRLASSAFRFDAGVLPPRTNDEIGELSGAFGNMAEQVRKSIEETRASEEKLRTLLDLCPLPISWRNNQGKIEFWNRKALELFGYEFQEIDTAEKWFSRAYPDPEYRQQVIREWEALAAEHDVGYIRTGESQITCKDGRVVTVEITGTHCGDLIVVIFNDVRHPARTYR